MNAGNWIELAVLLVTALGGGTVGVSKLTRIAVAAETLAEKIEAVTRTVAAVSTVVQEHETRISHMEGGSSRPDRPASGTSTSGSPSS